MNAEARSIPPVIPTTNQSIRYELTRRDIFLASLTIFLRSRPLQLFILALVIINGWFTLAPEFNERTMSENIAHLFGYLVVFCGFILVMQVIWGAIASYFQKHHGVVGQHILEITDAGLIERTETNETLHKWAGISRIISGPTNLYIYITSENFHMIPRRSFAPGELAAFEQEVRSRAQVK